MKPQRGIKHLSLNNICFFVAGLEADQELMGLCTLGLVLQHSNLTT